MTEIKEHDVVSIRGTVVSVHNNGEAYSVEIGDILGEHKSEVITLLPIDVRPVESKKDGSHHGPPDLLLRDISLLNAFRKWVDTVQSINKGVYSKNWFPSEIDCLKSRLFWRIRSGKEPLRYPPPTCWSCPWFELIEIPEAHTTGDPVRIHNDGGKVAYVAQDRYEVLYEGTMEDEEHASTISHGEYKFRVWNAPVKYKTLINGLEGEITRIVAHIRYIDEGKHLNV